MLVVIYICSLSHSNREVFSGEHNPCKP